MEVPGERRRFGVLVALEGPDGSGKSTQIGVVAGMLESVGLKVAKTFDPGGNPLGAGIRRLLKDPELQRHTPPAARRFLFAADRAAQQELLAELVRDHDVVITDRFSPVSETAYATAEGSSDECARMLLRAMPLKVSPDLVVLLDESRERLIARRKPGGVDPAERSDEVFETVLAAYRGLCMHALLNGCVGTSGGDSYRAKVVPVDDVEATARRIWVAVLDVIQERFA